MLTSGALGLVAASGVGDLWWAAQYSAAAWLPSQAAATGALQLSWEAPGLAEAWLFEGLVLAAVSVPRQWRWAVLCLTEEQKLLVQPHSQMRLHLAVLEQACWLLAGMQPLPVVLSLLLRLGWEVDWESD